MSYYSLNPYKQGHPTQHTMGPDRLERLKAMLSIPSTYGAEELVTQYVVNFCVEHNFDYIVDSLGSVLITKGILQPGEYYPSFSAHMDTVHKIATKEIVEKDNILTAWNNGIQVGIGGDDLAGCAACLEVLLLLPVVKVGLFIGEEVGCVGSRAIIKSHKDWFNDIGYMIEFDGPEDYMITQTCSGVELFENKGEFITKSFPLLFESMGPKMRFFNHPYTDVSVIKDKFPFSCINLSVGYFNYHSYQEYVVISEVEKAINLGLKMVYELGNNIYIYESKPKYGAYWRD